MKSTELKFNINESILLTLKEEKEEFIREMLFNNVLVLYRKGKLSLGKAAELAGYDKLYFIIKLQEEKEYIFDYTEDEINEMIQGAKNALKKMEE